VTRIRRLFRVLLLATCLVGGVVLTTLGAERLGYRFYVNLTPSVPRGLYLVDTHQRDPVTGSYVLFTPPDAAAAILYGRGYLRPGAPLVKQVHGLPGDAYCVTDQAIRIAGQVLGPVSLIDSKGRPLPRLRGCFTVPDASFLPLGLGLPNSFDGRYFGAVSDALIVGRARLLVEL
jgi:conjugative transfer signal peptidase TraF